MRARWEEIDKRGERGGRRVRRARWEESVERGERGGRKLMREESEMEGK